MFNSIFKKQFIINITILIFSYILLGTALSTALKFYFKEQKIIELKEQGEKIGILYEKAYRNIYYRDYVDFNEIKKELLTLEEHLEATYLLTDSSFIIKTSSDNLKYTIGQKLKINSLEVLLKGDIIDIEGNLNGLLKEDVLTVGYPVIVANQVIGSIFMNSSLPELQRTISEVYSIFLISIVISAWIAFIFIYISSKTISKPLLEMNNAAKIISNGDFEKRIYANSKDEVGQLANSFNMMAESLFKQEKARRDFIANVSHDLRSPLTSMSGYLQAILDGTIPKDNQKKYLKIILEETSRLSKLASDILILNSISMMDLEITKFDINELVRKTIIQFEKRVLDKNIELFVNFADEKNIVECDYDKIQRVVYNLVDNAIKFTNINGNIVIETTTDKDKVMFMIKDDGIGIKREDQKYVFDRFYKSDTSRGKDRNGSGLGLSISKEFIKAHNETISLSSGENKGCKIIISLPIAKK